jgi:hypothetical protein
MPHQVACYAETVPGDERPMSSNLVQKDVDLEEYGREIGVLQPFESLRSE